VAEVTWTALLRRFDWQRETPYPPEVFLAMCLEVVKAGFYGTRHPLALRWLEGQLSPDQLRFMAMQEYWYFRGTVWWNAGKVLHCPDLADQLLLLGPLMDEAGIDGAAHHELFVRYLGGLGIDITAVQQAGILPQTLTCVDEFYNLNAHGHLVESLAANNLVAETMRPIQYPQVLKAFKEYYTWVPEESLEFFRVHMEADVGHAELGEKLFKKYAQSISAQRLAWSALTRSLAARWCLYDGILRYLDAADPPLVPVWDAFPAVQW
jgi:pyrroloquinoline quinone (PQQ) biosynthesis protein C